MPVIGEGHRPRLEHITHLCQFLTLLALGDSANQLDMDEPCLSGTLFQAADQSCRIHYRSGIGHGGNPGKAACRCCLGAGDKILLGLLARLTEMHMHVNEARGHHFAGSIINLCPLGFELLADCSNLAILNQHICYLVEFVLRIDDPAALQ